MNSRTHKRQQGASLLLVLVLLTVMLLGIVTIARRGEANVLVNGTVANKDAALQASEVGVSEAYASLHALTTPDTADPSWYYPTKQVDDTAGLPTGITWSNMKTVSVGAYTVRYLVERLCTVSPVTDIANQCSIKTAYNGDSSKAGTEALLSVPGVQYRITVNVTGPKNINTLVQALAVN